MAVTRNVHKFSVPVRSENDWGTFHTTEPKLVTLMNKTMASNERIVGTHYIDGDWVIITETYGLGPKGT